MDENRPAIIIVREPLEASMVEEYARGWFGDMVKIVVDVGRHLLAMGGQFHADAKEVLLGDGSAQVDLWGANVYPFRGPHDRLEYTALINMRPVAGNRSMEVQDQEIRREMRDLVNLLLPPGGIS